MDPFDLAIIGGGTAGLVSAAISAGIGVDVIEGTARFVGPDAVEVDGRRVRAKRWIIATGSCTAVPPISGLEEAGYLTHETVWNITEQPRSLLVIGGGPIGVEMAQTFARLGSEVNLANSAGHVLNREDPEISAVLEASLRRDGIIVHAGARVLSVRTEGAEQIAEVEGAGGVRMEIRVHAIFIATGRIANVEGLGLDVPGVESGPDGICVDDTLRTSATHIYAAGDVVGPYRFTHVADYQARLAVPNALFPIRRSVDYRVVPWCTYTDPEVARVGITEIEARAEWGDKAGVYRYQHDSLDRAVCDGEGDGLTKLVTDPKGRLVGAHIAGPREKFSGGLARKAADLAVKWFV